MNDKGASPSRAENSSVRFRSVPFSSIPGQSRLFLEFQQSSHSLRELYPNAVDSIDELVAQASSVIAESGADRRAVCNALVETNKAFDADGSVFENIELLRRDDCVAVVTGQQAGLFTGPLYTIYKALTAIRISARLRELGVTSVPVFWIATEDHDFEEVSHAESQDDYGEIFSAAIPYSESEEGIPVGKVRLPDSVDTVVREFIDRIPATEYKGELEAILNSSWSTGNTFGTGFGKNIARLLSRFALIMLDPSVPKLKQLASPIYEAAIQNSQKIVSALQDRNALLSEKGFHAQVMVSEDHFPLFRTTESGARSALRITDNGKFFSRVDKREFTAEELLGEVGLSPEGFSPGVMLRSVVQDFLLPTICYVGGAAEVAYFAQNSETYRVLGRRVTPIIHRQSFTLIEPKHTRTMEKYSLDLEDLFKDAGSILTQIAESQISPGVAELFTDVEKSINIELDRLDQELETLDPTLVDSLKKRRAKINYHIENLRGKAARSTILKNDVASRKIHALLLSVVPNGSLQERVLNFSGFYARYGPQLFDRLVGSIDVDERGHVLVYL